MAHLLLEANHTVTSPFTHERPVRDLPVGGLLMRLSAAQGWFERAGCGPALW